MVCRFPTARLSMRRPRCACFAGRIWRPGPCLRPPTAETAALVLSATEARAGLRRNRKGVDEKAADSQSKID
jgi:hypothetical protein